MGTNLATSVLGKPGRPVCINSSTVLERRCDDLNEKNGKFLNM